MDQPAPEIDAIFLAALDKTSPEERTGYLDVACGQDAELRKRVERLLNAYPKGGRELSGISPGGAPADHGYIADPGTARYGHRPLQAP